MNGTYMSRETLGVKSQTEKKSTEKIILSIHTFYILFNKFAFYLYTLFICTYFLLVHIFYLYILFNKFPEDKTLWCYKIVLKNLKY